MKIVGVDDIYLTPKDLKRLQAKHDIKIYNDLPDEQEGIKRLINAEIIITDSFPITKTVLESLPRIQQVVVAATGFQHIDLAETKKRNILVSNCPDYSTEAVAEHTIGLLMAAARLITPAEKAVRNGEWKPNTFIGKQLQNKTLGMIGYGNIGQRIAEIAEKGLGMKVLHSNSKTSRKDFEKLLQESDAICLALPLNKHTKGMLGKKEFAMMKDGVVFVNASRGGIIDEEALLENLQNGKIFSAGLDVLTIEPMHTDHPIFELPNVTITPHIAFNTEEAQEARSKLITDNILSFLEGNPENVVS